MKNPNSIKYHYFASKNADVLDEVGREELLAEFEAKQARIRACLGVKKARRGRLYLKRGKHASSGKQQRRPRGRPRKQK